MSVHQIKEQSDDPADICEEFGIDPPFVEFVWATMNAALKPSLPAGAWLPRTKRECALSCVIALRSGKHKKKKRRR